ncbi:hypothetical protein PybrP1_006513, partial [[Pythium] brassicae (nom. inval.)]
MAGMVARVLKLQAALRIPDGDVLVHAGDFTDTGDRDEVLAFNAFLGRLPHRYKLVVAGNHESTFDRQFYPFNWQHYGHCQQFDPDEVRALLTNALYLEDQAVLIEGYKFYGSPWQPEFCNWAFNLPRGEELRAKWRRIPSDTDVLVTHTPPLGRGDRVGATHVGCEELAREVSDRVRPQLHVFGHVHEGYGKSSDGTTIYVNASSCTHEYDAVNAPFVFDLAASKSADHESDGAALALALDYARMFHEQLRVCSQKAPFVPKPRAAGVKNESQSAGGPRRRLSLREFRVDGTTSGLLLESTLKLRPVVGEQTRALRYLFHNGFSGRAGGGAEAPGDAVVKQLADAAREPTAASDASAQRQSARAAAPRRPVQRRVTMAVLDHVSEGRELSESEILTLESFASALTLSAEAGDAGAGAKTSVAAPAARARRSKTLRRRDGLARLAPMPEEPDEKSPQEAASSSLLSRGESAAGARRAAAASGVSAVAAVVEVVVVAPPPAAVAVVVECTLCKYKVPGHVHPGGGSAPGALAALPPPPPAVAAAAVDVVVIECTLCKYK